MDKLFEILEKKNISLPENVIAILNECKSYSVFDTVGQLADAAVGSGKWQL